MSIKVTTNKKALIYSGIVNIVWDEDPSMVFDVEGLPVKLELKILPENANVNTEVVVDASEKNVLITHRLKSPNAKKIDESGIMIPLELAQRASGQMIYMTWYIVTKQVSEGGFVSVITYSFYEDADE